MSEARPFGHFLIRVDRSPIAPQTDRGDDKNQTVVDGRLDLVHDPVDPAGIEAEVAQQALHFLEGSLFQRARRGVRQDEGERDGREQERAPGCQHPATLPRIAQELNLLEGRGRGARKARYSAPAGQPARPAG